MIELLSAATVGIPILAGLVSWFLDGRRARRLGLASLAITVLAGSGLAGATFAEGTVTAFDGLVVVDALGAYVLVLVLVVAAIAGFGSPDELAHTEAAGTLRPSDAGRYYALFLWFVAGLAAVPLVDNLGLVWVGIEATTIVSALLVGFSRTPQAIEAAWKYLILGSIGIGFALLGTLLIYASSVELLGETSDALAWSRLIEISPQVDPALARLAFLFALAGYGTKAGLAPFHTWLPDAHSQAPSPISALLSGAALAVALYALMRFHLVTVGALGTTFSSTLLVVFGLLSLAVALPFMVSQGDLKRLLAYSSVEHIGLATLALGFGGRLALLGLTLHLMAHGLTKATIFLAAGRLVAERGTRRIGRLAGSLGRVPADGRALVVAAVILAGLPPSAIFAAEIAILIGGVQAGWGLAAGIAAVILALTVAALLFHLVRMVTGPARASDQSPLTDASRGPATASEAATAAPRELATGAGQGASRGKGRALILGIPLGIVIAAGLWTPPALLAALEQVVRVLGRGHG